MAYIRSDHDGPRHHVRATCPTTGETVKVDAMTTEEFDALSPGEGGTLLACPECGSRHAWTKADAWIPPTAAT